MGSLIHSRDKKLGMIRPLRERILSLIAIEARKTPEQRAQAEARIERQRQAMIAEGRKPARAVRRER